MGFEVYGKLVVFTGIDGDSVRLEVGKSVYKGMLMISTRGAVPIMSAYDVCNLIGYLQNYVDTGELVPQPDDEAAPDDEPAPAEYHVGDVFVSPYGSPYEVKDIFETDDGERMYIVAGSLRSADKLSADGLTSHI